MHKARCNTNLKRLAHFWSLKGMSRVHKVCGCFDLEDVAATKAHVQNQRPITGRRKMDSQNTSKIFARSLFFFPLLSSIMSPAFILESRSKTINTCSGPKDLLRAQWMPRLICHYPFQSTWFHFFHSGGRSILDQWYMRFAHLY